MKKIDELHVQILVVLIVVGVLLAVVGGELADVIESGGGFKQLIIDLGIWVKEIDTEIRRG